MRDLGSSDFGKEPAAVQVMTEQTQARVRPSCRPRPAPRRLRPRQRGCCACPTQSSFSMRPSSCSASSTLAMSSSEKLAICSNLMTLSWLQPAGEIGVDALDLRQIVGLALRLLEALPGGVQAAGARVRALDDAGRLAAAAAQIIELGAAHLAAADDLDLGDVGRVDREHALHALAVGDLAHGEVLVDAAAGAGDDDALVGLRSRTLSPSITFTITLTVSPGPNSGTPRLAVMASICSRSSSWMMFMGHLK